MVAAASYARKLVTACERKAAFRGVFSAEGMICRGSSVIKSSGPGAFADPPAGVFRDGARLLLS